MNRFFQWWTHKAAIQFTVYTNERQGRFIAILITHWLLKLDLLMVNACGFTRSPIFMTFPYALILLFARCIAIPDENIDRPTEIGLENVKNIVEDRNRFDLSLSNYSHDTEYYQQSFSQQNTNILIRIKKSELKMDDNMDERRVECTIVYNSTSPWILSYDLDSIQSASIINRTWVLLPASRSMNISISVQIDPKELGLTYLRFWIRAAQPSDNTKVQIHSLELSSNGLDLYYMTVMNKSHADIAKLGFPVLVLRGKGIAQIIFRVIVIFMVTIFTFTMGCEVKLDHLRAYARRPIGPAIGLLCQFIIMPLVAFSIGNLVPIRKEFGFGLLTIGCSPGGGASNAWALMLGGDLNLSILMTFVSSVSSLFMLPLLLFIFGRFFIDVKRVTIPYGNICLQLLQISTPCMCGMFVGWWKPNWAARLIKITRPLFLFFILYFLTFGIYANWSIIRLMGSYPIVIPTSALLPWLGFSLAALVAFLLCQARSVIITVALETGIQNVGAAILVLLYSMPQPSGDLGAVMPITVSLFTPLPLSFILLGLTIKRRCYDDKPPPISTEVSPDANDVLLRGDDNYLKEANNHTQRD